MKDYTSTELANNTGDVLLAAAREAVGITRHGKPQFVILTNERFEEMRRNSDPRQALRVAALSDTDRAELLAALDETIDDR